jgi:hypothetical protein
MSSSVIGSLWLFIGVHLEAEVARQPSSANRERVTYLNKTRKTPGFHFAG